jgi:putative endonuclease
MPVLTQQTTRELGRRGEDVACEYLQNQGLVVLSRNWMCRDGELDIVATDGETLVVCEVKTRSSGRFGGPEETVSHQKLERVRRLGLRWLAAYRVGWCHVRVDLVFVLWPPDGEVRLRHLRGA